MLDAINPKWRGLVIGHKGKSRVQMVKDYRKGKRDNIFTWDGVYWILNKKGLETKDMVHEKDVSLFR